MQVNWLLGLGGLGGSWLGLAGWPGGARMGPVGSGRSLAGAWPEPARPGRVQPAAHGIPMINNLPKIKDY
ncbi:MAG: hypothetical protein CMK50_03405 [Propionibacteriaceae bacterium]|nr:hypothetical protein [Propionibacteriaceae bacterium]